MITYERVTYRPEGASRSRTIYLENPADGKLLGAPVLSGWEVDREGSPKDTLHVICTELIRKRTPMLMNKRYCELEPA